MSKVRVLQLITRMVRGGADENTAYIVKGLDGEKYDVDLYAGIGSDREVFEDLEIKIIPHLVREINIWSDFLAFVELYRVIRKNRYHIVHTNTAKVGILGRFAAYLNRVPVIVHTIHGTTFPESLEPWRQNFYVLLEKLAARFTDKMISVGDDLTRKYQEKGIGRKEQYITIKTGMDLDKFFEAGEIQNDEIESIKKEIGVDLKKRIVTQVARLEPRKGYNFLVEAAKIITKNNPDVIFLVAGEGYFKEEIQNMIRNAGLKDNFLLLGYRDDVEKIIAISDLVVLASLWEGLPRVLVQAAAVGKPIVTFAIEGAWEVVKEDLNGYIVDIGDVPRFAERIIEIIDDPEKARIMGKKGREIIGDEWDVDVMVKNVDNLYSELLEKTDLKSSFT